ncbi:mRNA-degrading endonuclease RelE, toxin component of the RelBE toxin-antitoxin system [Halopenitus malekzadehii]|uniref:mRNA-degrading endonuclease RelE, toxin component of the RelBE toxin-antitoxin system n=1 Tax=Halopenitus malekzadehii TaxID=1267564 RepID=A0A1H6JNR8_9EURY|nr:plasmid stabilization protein [Halopenitus malekzadehii]SEH60933.1 mRNA-degrading endonuclease RelE, toxin component of the RelBE toxin-antitoxin system [Halopenitus malekzadehii]
MSYSVHLSEQASEYYQALDDKSQRIVKENLEKLEDEPYPKPGAGSGDREKIVVDGEEIYRLHIGRTHTALYDVVEDRGQVKVVELLGIDEAHDRYGY